MPSSQSLSTALVAFLLTAFPIATASCNADNCLRAIRGTSIPGRVSEGLADCSSYLFATVTPATSTSTAFTTSTTTLTQTCTQTITSIYGSTVLPTTSSSSSSSSQTTQPPPLGPGGIHFRNPDLPAPTDDGPISSRAETAAIELRQATATPTAIPTYASACSGAVRYSSACSCIGVSTSTITLPTPTAVVTVTVPATATVVQTVVETDTVCAPPTYGYLFTGGMTNASPNQTGLDLSYPFDTAILSLGDCCAFCFGTPGCVLYYLYNSPAISGCGLFTTSAGTAPDADATCPNGRVAEETDAGSAFGVGPCVLS